MSIELSRRHFIAGAAALGSIPAFPAFARSARDIGGNWSGVQAFLDQTVGRKYVPGAGAALARGTDQADFFVAGTLAQDSTTPITPDSLFRAYSMTKPVAGIAAMMLIEDGKLKLDQNIADILPAFANPRVLIDGSKSLKSRPAQAPITIRNLLTHTAGIGYAIVTKGPLLQEYLRLGLNGAQISRKPLPGVNSVPNPPTLEEFANRLATLPLMFDPGVRWSYSLSLDLLGRVIEVAGGMPFDAFLKTRIFDPLGMTSTWFVVPQSEAKRLTTNYVGGPFGAFPVDPGNDSCYFDPIAPFGGSGLVTSMRDYDRFLAMLMGKGSLGQTRVMSATTASHAMSNLVHPDTKMDGFVKGQGFGAGGRVTITDDVRGSGIGTFGWGGAASTIAWVDPARGIRASGWTQIMIGENAPFPDGFGKAVYAGLGA